MTESAAIESKNKKKIRGIKIEAFCRAMEESKRFDIIAVIKDNTVFVLEDSKKEKNSLGHQIEIDVDEVETAPLDSIIAVLYGRKSIILDGITRIVGYYSRVSNWNKSKVGELRDRAKGEYGTRKFKPVNQKSRLSYIDNH